MNAAQSWNDTQLFLENLGAIEDLNPGLAARLCEPVGTEHVVFRSDGEVRLRWRGETQPLMVDEQPDELASLDVQLDRPILVFGVGIGDQLRRLLDATEDTPVVAWERDPWLLGLAIGFYDFSAELKTGRLQFALGADLFEILPPPGEEPNAVFHPLLTAVYRNEWRLFCDGGSRPRALIATGGAIADEAADGLRATGRAVYTLDLANLSAAEVDHAITKSEADCLVVVDHAPGLPEFCAERNLRLVVWEVGGLSERIPRAHGSTAHVRVRTVAPSRQEDFCDAGYEDVGYLPAAADLELRRPVVFKPADMARYLCSVAAVGPSLVDEARRARGRFIGLIEAWLGRTPEAAHEAQELSRALLSMQRREDGNYCIPELLDSHFPDFVSSIDLARDEDPVALIGLVAASERRLRLMESLSPYRPHVWGDIGWRATRDAGVWYRGRPPVGFERNKVYVGAQVNVVLDTLHEPDHVPPVVYDTMACGALVLAPHSAALEDVFEVGVEVASWRTSEELITRTAHFLAHPDEARRIAERGQRAVRERHGIGQRLADLIAR
jgi:hypothetical protein